MDNRQAVLKTLLYSDIFNYPLTKDEIWKFLISDKKIDKKTFNILIKSKNTNNMVHNKDGFYFIKGKEVIVLKRKKRKLESVEKMGKAKRIIKLLSFIPFIKFIGVSGALSMENSDKRDDIDIFVIAKRQFVWTTRFFIITFLKLIKEYRARKDRDYTGKICLNMIIGEDEMGFNKSRQDLYTAHEITQLLPIFDKDNTYNKFINLNSWVKKYMPNVLINKIYISRKTNTAESLLIVFAKFFLLEKILRFIQFEYMKSSITKESVEKNFLAFHPIDYRTKTLTIYKKKLNKLGIKD